LWGVKKKEKCQRAAFRKRIKGKKRYIQCLQSIKASSVSRENAGEKGEHLNTWLERLGENIKSSYKKRNHRKRDQPGRGVRKLDGKEKPDKKGEETCFSDPSQTRKKVLNSQEGRGQKREPKELLAGRDVHFGEKNITQIVTAVEQIEM